MFFKNNEKNDKSQYDKTSKLTKSITENINLFKNIFNNDELLIIRRFQNKHLPEAKCCVIYFEAMVDKKILNENIIEPILSSNLKEDISSKNLLDELQYKTIVSHEVKESNDMDSIISSVIYGDTIFLLDGYDTALIISSKGWQTRAVTEPESAKVVRGPREGFTESININISLLRRKIRNPDLKFKFKEIGERTHTKVCISYIEGIAQNEILSELEDRLDKIEIDAILDSGYIQELIRDAPFSPFETVGNSERPDVVAAKLLEGRIAIFVDGSPFVLTVPYIVIENAQSNEDYYNNYIFSSINRFLRTMATILSISVPAIFLAIVTYHQEMLPTPLLLSISASRQGVPFPTVVTLLFMLLMFDILREAGTRIPTPIGQAINIVGALVLGQAAVEAKLVSAPVIIITALSGILTLMNSNIIGATIVVRTFLLLLSSVLGIYGFIFGLIGVLIHLMTIRSFGVPYMLNITKIKNHNFQDILIRVPWWAMKLRPKIIGAKNQIRILSKRSRK